MVLNDEAHASPQPIPMKTMGVIVHILQVKSGDLRNLPDTKEPVSDRVQA